VPAVRETGEFMLNERLKAAGMVADQLIPAERSIDASIERNASLTLAMLAARSEAGLPFSVGQDALDHVITANTHLIQARRAFVDAHRALAETRDRIGLRTRAFGDNSQCPDDDAFTSATLDERPVLRAVNG
jgi:hypothetical protein